MASCEDIEWFYGPPTKKQRTTAETEEVELEQILEGVAKTPKSCNVVSRVARDTLSELSLGGFETFGRQRDALAKLEETRKIFKDSRLFSYELLGSEHKGGERRYLVTTISRFWHWYESQSSRHLYELIPENWPCRMYFDLEYSKLTNVDIDHEKIFNQFIAASTKILSEMFDIEVDPNKRYMMLDSSSSAKFSCHVICHLPKLFPSSNSIRGYSDRLSAELQKDEENLVWNSDSTRKVTIFDTSVYSRNRNVRLFLSSKQGKTAVLRLAKYCSFYGFRKPSDMEIFFDALCVPIDFEKREIFHITTVNDVVDGSPNVRNIDTKVGNVVGYSGTSPFPQVDEFILLVLRRWVSNSTIRQWKIVYDGPTPIRLVYYPANNRFCFNIDRKHKSNGTYWTVDLVKKVFYQRCFDPDCRGAQSNEFSLPEFVVKTLLELNDGGSVLNNSACEGNLNSSLCETTFREEDVSRFFEDWDQLFEA